MYNSDKNKTPADSHSKKNDRTGSTLNLKPNEAYEPGFGKYTLTESELRAQETKQQEKQQTTSKTSQRSASDNSSTYNGPGVNHYPENIENKEEEERKLREENTRKHNNW